MARRGTRQESAPALAARGLQLGPGGVPAPASTEESAHTCNGNQQQIVRACQNQAGSYLATQFQQQTAVTPRPPTPAHEAGPRGNIFRLGTFLGFAGRGNRPVMLSRVGIFLDSVGSSARTEGPHGARAQASGRNRIDPYWGGIERLATRTS